MFVRKVEVRQGGKTYTYHRLVENYREDGKLKQKVLLSLGQGETAARMAVKVIDALSPIAKSPFLTPSQLAEKLTAENAREVGVTLIGNQLWELAGIPGILSEVAHRVDSFEKTEALIRAMVLNRLSDPESKYGIFRWFKKAHIGQGHELLSDYSQKDLTDRFYRAMDVLLPKQKAIEDRIYRNLRNLFSMELDLVFYDITSSYFEGMGTGELAERGHSRDHRSDRPQIVIGLLMAQGLPVAHHVFKGGTKDSTTVEGVLDDLLSRFPKRIKAHVFICTLSFLLECILRQKLEMSGVKMTAPAALDEMKSMHRIKDSFEQLALYRFTEPTKDQEAILDALGLKDRVRGSSARIEYQLIVVTPREGQTWYHKRVPQKCNIPPLFNAFFCLSIYISTTYRGDTTSMLTLG